MHYFFKKQTGQAKWVSGWIDTSDCVVVETSRSWKLLLGKKIDRVLRDLNREEYLIHVCEFKHARSKVFARKISTTDFSFRSYRIPSVAAAASDVSPT